MLGKAVAKVRSDSVSIGQIKAEFRYGCVENHLSRNFPLALFSLPRSPCPAPPASQSAAHVPHRGHLHVVCMPLAHLPLAARAITGRVGLRIEAVRLQARAQEINSNRRSSVLPPHKTLSDRSGGRPSRSSVSAYVQKLLEAPRPRAECQSLEQEIQRSWCVNWLCACPGSVQVVGPALGSSKVSHKAALKPERGVAPKGCRTGVFGKCRLGRVGEAAPRPRLT